MIGLLRCKGFCELGLERERYARRALPAGAAVAAQDVTSLAGHVQIARISGVLPGILWLQQTLGAHLQYRRMKASEWIFSRWLAAQARPTEPERPLRRYLVPGIIGQRNMA